MEIRKIAQESQEIRPQTRDHKAGNYEIGNYENYRP